VHKNPPNSSKQHNTHHTRTRSHTPIIAKLLITNFVSFSISLSVVFQVVSLWYFWTFQINDFVLFFSEIQASQQQHSHTHQHTYTNFYLLHMLYICHDFNNDKLCLYILSFKHFFIYLSFQSKKIPLFIQKIFFVFYL